MVEREAPGLGCKLFRYFAPSNISLAISEPGAIAAKADEVLMTKYANLDASYFLYQLQR